MTEALIKIVLFHSDGHRIWLAPWLEWVYLIVILLWVVWTTMTLIVAVTCR